ncbi:uncharacterized protein PRCAT00005269001 [Priceomyces carsonii]|uniref:uncharacterized protein n=1 Tax=Priceomyces carsonii TaxID=28549 RepID=UPI002ED95D66|nr:unnamed protein product [Priceomyces carsonii]
MDEVDIELVNQELNFLSQDNSLIIKGGCDLFSTKPVGSDRKLFKTIDKNLDQMLEDNQLSQSIERERNHSMNSLFGSSASPPGNGHMTRRGSYVISNERERRGSRSLSFNKSSIDSSFNNKSNLSNSIVEGQDIDSGNTDESPFGPLSNVTTRKTFSYLIAILNSTFPDHDFTRLQPTTENFHKIDTSEDFMRLFNNIMVSLGKKEDLLNWIWDTINVHMDFIPPKSAAHNYSGTGSRSNSFSKQGGKFNQESPTFQTSNNEPCQIYEFQPSDQSIIEDLNYPFQSMWSYYWFIYNKKKKRVAFIYLKAINKIHFSMVENRSYEAGDNKEQVSQSNAQADDEMDDVYLEDYGNEDAIIDDDDKDIVGDIEL